MLRSRLLFDFFEAQLDLLQFLLFEAQLALLGVLSCLAVADLLVEFVDDLV